MRVAVLSDIHGNVLALGVVLKSLRARAADIIVNLGDCVTGPLWPRDTIDLLDTLAIPTVRGNHDRWLSDDSPQVLGPSVEFTRSELSTGQLSRLSSLPPTLSLDDDVLAVHGTPTCDTSYLLEEERHGQLMLATAATIGSRVGNLDRSLVLCGHSHHQGFVELPGGCSVLNPGSVGGPRYADSGTPVRAEGSTNHACYAVATRRGQRWQCELHAVPYDVKRVVQRARENGRADWAAAFSQAG